LIYFVEMKPVQASSMVNTKTFETAEVINLKPPPFDHNKSFDDEDDDGFSAIPIVPKKEHVAPPDDMIFLTATT